MGRQLTPGEPIHGYSGSKAICALRTLQARLEQLESEREKAFEKSMDVHQIAAKELEEMKSSYEVELDQYRSQQEVFRKEIESVTSENRHVLDRLDQSEKQRDCLEKQLAEVRKERDDLAQNLNDARAQVDSLLRENEQIRHQTSNNKQKNGSRSSLKNARSSEDIHKSKLKAGTKQRTIPQRLRSAYSNEEVPFLTTVAKSSHNLTASIQSALSGDCCGKSPDPDRQRSMLTSSIDTMTESVTNLMASLSQEPSVKAYQQMSELRAKIETAREQISERQRRRPQTRAQSPESRRCYERKLRMLSILRKFKSDVFGAEDKTAAS